MTIQRRIGVHMSDDEMKLVEPADEVAFRSPVPTQVVSNGEYNPLPQTDDQKKVEGLIKELADVQAKRHNISRRQFLASSAGMATAFLAMNKVFGPVWDVSEAEAADMEMSTYRAGQLSGQFIFDDQTHFIRDDFKQEGLLGLTKWAVGANVNPHINDAPMTLSRYKMDNYLKEIFLDSDTKMSLLSGAPFDDPSWWLLSNDAIQTACRAVNKMAGSTRMLGHTVITPKYPNWMDEVDRGIESLHPVSWKSYTIGDPFGPSKYAGIARHLIHRAAGGLDRVIGQQPPGRIVERRARQQRHLGIAVEEDLLQVVVHLVAGERHRRIVDVRVDIRTHRPLGQAEQTFLLEIIADEVGLVVENELAGKLAGPVGRPFSGHRSGAMDCIRRWRRPAWGPENEMQLRPPRRRVSFRHRSCARRYVFELS